jgi:DNA repair protein SbcC/Rad50
VKPVRLQMVGLRSWKTERELLFEGVDLAAVIGPTGAGKSSILEGIVYALYNGSTYDKRGVGSLISSDAKTMSVTLDFDANGERWRSTRSTSRTNYPPSVHKLSCLTNPAAHPAAEGERAVNAAIEELIGLDFDQFLTAVLLPQGRFQTLLMASPAERAGILKGVFRLDELDEIRDLATRVRREQIEPMLETKQGERSHLLPNPEATLAEATSEVDRSTQTIRKLDDLKEQHDGFTVRASELDTAAKVARQQADALGTATNAIPSLDGIAEAELAIGTEEAELRDKRTSHVTERDRAQATIDEAASAGITIETLSAARHVLDTAKTTLPALAADEETLKTGREALAEQQRALERDTEEHAKQVAQLTSSTETIGSLKTSADQTSAQLTDATNALRTLRTFEEKAVTAAAAVTGHEKQLAAVTTSASDAAAQATTDKTAADDAQTALDVARREHQVAHLAADLHAGESCPICQRELPDDYTPPEAPSALKAAETEATRLRTTADDSAAAANKAVANVETLSTQLVGLRATSDLATEKATEARSNAEGLIGPIDLALDDANLLAAIRRAAEDAKSTHETADRALTVTKARIDSASDGLQQRAQTCVDRQQQLDNEVERIDRERERQASALTGLAADIKPGADTQEALATAGDACAAKLKGVQTLHDSIRTKNREIEQLDNRLVALAKKRTEEIDNPRREAANHAREIVSKIRELQPTGKAPTQPTEAGTLAEHVAWVKDISKLALDIAQALRARATDEQLASSKATKAAEETLRTANDVVEGPITTSAELAGELNTWRARLLAAEKERDKAIDQLPKVALLDTQIDKLRGRRESLEEVARLLGDGQFIKWLVGRRQQLLLVVASEIFAGMTGARYRFAADFTIIDGRTGIARNSRTLSGGEGFMASLALALGMAEIAARSGGRIGSLYLDEGFGALDPNALDEAINALELRAQSGQMILIVSHVPAIAQRIERILQVRPDPEGSSAEWLDDEDREYLLVEAAAAEV